MAGTVKRPSQKSDLDTRKAAIFTSFFVKCIFISFDLFFFLIDLLVLFLPDLQVLYIKGITPCL